MTLKAAFTILVATCTAGLAHPLGTTEVVWHQFFSGPDDTMIREMVRMPNGDIVYVGEIDNGTQKLFAIRQDVNGNTIWSKTFSKPGAPGDIYAKVARLSPFNGNIYVACEVTGNATLKDFYVIQIDPAGNMVNDRTVDVNNNDHVGDMEIGTLGNVFFGGDSLSATQPTVVKMDPNFLTLWTYNFGNPAAVVSQGISDIEISPTGQVLIAGGVDNGGQLDVGLDRVDSFGTVVYQKTIGDPALSDGDASIVDATDGSTYLTYVRGIFTVGAKGRISKFDPVGVFQWNFDSPDLDRVGIAEIPGGDMAFVGSEDDQPCRTEFYRLNPAGNQLWSYSHLQPLLDRDLLEDVTVGSDGTIFSRSTTDLASQIGADWGVIALAANGTPLYEWSFDTAPGNYDISSAMLPLADRGLIIGGYGPNGAVTNMHAFRLNPVLYVAPASTTLRLGRVNAGTLSSLVSNDNDYYEVCKAFVPNVLTPPVNLEFDATLPIDYIVGDVGFGTIVKANTPGLQQNTELWNWTANAWEKSTLTTLGFAELPTIVDGDPSRHLQVGTNNVRARVRISKIGFTAIASWCVQIDQALWRVTP